MGAKYNWKFLNFWLEFTPFVYVRCTKCHARGPIGRTEDEAIKRWNGDFGAETGGLMEMCSE